MVSDDWQDRGACRLFPVEIFFPPAEQEADEAKAICARCEVRQPCLEFAIAAGERFGIWGGLTTQERRALVAARRRNRARQSQADELRPTFTG